MIAVCAHAWECGVGDILASPHYFAPPVSPTGVPVLEVTAFHRDYPEGRVFVRIMLGAGWVRFS